MKAQADQYERMDAEQKALVIKFALNRKVYKTGEKPKCTECGGALRGHLYKCGICNSWETGI